MGLKTIIFQTPGELNLSPLKGNLSVNFVSSENEIRNALKKSKPKKIMKDFLSKHGNFVFDVKDVSFLFKLHFHTILALTTSQKLSFYSCHACLYI